MVLLNIEALRKDFGGLAAVDGIDLALDEGELHVIVGPNGCGKSTLFNLISGALAPTSGHIRFLGRDIAGWPVDRIARAGIGRKFQVPAVFDDLTVLENLNLPGWSAARLSMFRTADLAPRSELLAPIKLDGKANQPAGMLSHGERQWLEIGMLLASQARLLLLDEPTAGMTTAETASTVDLIRDLRADRVLTVLVIEHDMGFVEALGCGISVMAKGSILKSGSFAELHTDPEVRELYFGRAA